MDAFTQDYLKAVLPEFTYIFGRRLRPFSLAHWVTLWRLDSPFLSGDEITFKDLLRAAWVCSHTYEEILDRWHPVESPHRALGWYLAHSFLGLRGLRYPQMVKLIQDHIDRSFERPMVRPTSADQGEVELNSPITLVLTVHLMEKAHQSLSDVMNQPLPLTYWIYSTMAEKTGGAELATEEQVIEEAKEQEERELNADAVIVDYLKNKGGANGLS